MCTAPARLLVLLCAAVAVWVLPGCGDGGETDTGASTATPATEKTPGGGGSSKAAARDRELVSWPGFGRVPERTHYLPADRRELDPPLKKAWEISTHGLIEFPPALANGVAYVVNKFGNAKAVRLRDHEVLWQRITHRNRGNPTDVTAPLYHRGKVYFAYLDGYLVAVQARTGKLAWRRNLHAHLESSPLAVGGTIYIGTDETDVVALRAADGKTRWRFDSPAAIKASPSHHDGRVFVGDYESGMFCLDARTGRPIWRTNTSRVAPYGEGGFYSSPALAFGRVYAARDDGRVYAFDQRTGKVAWSFATGDFVYGSPAVARVPGTPPTVYIGSENSRFFALHALSGKLRWHYDVGGPVPGTAAVVGHTVYTTSFQTRDAIGLDVHTHEKTFELDDAGYTPIVSDGRRLYLVGYYKLIGLKPAR